MHLSKVFFRMLTLKALTKLNVTYYDIDLNVSMNQYN